MAASNNSLRSYVDRILYVMSQQDALGGDKKEIYKEVAEAKLDRTVVAQLVGHLRKKAKKPGKFAEQSVLFDQYLSDYEGTGTLVATHAAREKPITHSTEPDLTQVAADASPTGSDDSRAVGATVSAEADQAPSIGDVSPGPQLPDEAAADASTGGEHESLVPSPIGKTAARQDDAADSIVDETVGRDGAPALASVSDVEAVAPDFVTSIQRTYDAGQKFDPETHYLNSQGIKRLHGCQKPEACGGTWRQRCFGCQLAYAEAHGETA